MNRYTSISTWRTACEVATIAAIITLFYSLAYGLAWALVALGWHA